MEQKIHTQTIMSTPDTAGSFALPRDPMFWSMSIILALLLVLVILFPLRVAGDIPLYVDLGGRVIDGQRPYIDFFDINPPTIHFLNLLPVAVSRLTGLHPIPVFHLFIWLIVAGAAGDLREGAEEAAEAIDKGLANALLNCWIAACND